MAPEVPNKDRLGGVAAGAQVLHHADPDHQILLDKVAEGEPFAEECQVAIAIRLTGVGVVLGPRTRVLSESRRLNTIRRPVMSNAP